MNKDHLIELTNYLEVFKKQQYSAGVWIRAKQDDVMSEMPYVQYTKEIKEFEEKLTKYHLEDLYYDKHLYENDWWNIGHLHRDIQKMTIQNVLTCFTAIFKYEKFVDGTIKDFFESGIVIELLSRLKELITE